MSRRDAAGLMWRDDEGHLHLRARGRDPKDAKKKKRTKEQKAQSRERRFLTVERPELPAWVPPKELPTHLLTGKHTLSIDTETFDPFLFTRGPGWAYEGPGFLVSVALASDDREWYFPIRQPWGDTPAPDYGPEQVLAFLRDLGKNPDLSSVMFNRQYDEGWLWKDGVEFAGRVIDSSSAAALLNEYLDSYSLESISKTYLGSTKDERLLRQAGLFFGHNKNPKSVMHKIPAAYAAGYGMQDSRLALDLWRVFRPKLIEEDLTNVFTKEMKLHPLLAKMRRRGVRVDVEKAEQLDQKFREQEKTLTDRVKTLTGVDISEGLFGTVELVAALKTRGIEPPKHGNKYSITKGWLAKHSSDEVVRMIGEARKLAKVRGTFVEGYILNLHVNGRVYGQFNPLMSDDGGTVSGRLSSTTPNLQNIPARDPVLGPLIRSLFLPEEGELWAACDYSQQEPRLLVHFAAWIGAPGARLAVQRYREDPTTDFHRFASELTGLNRTDAKQLNLAIIYGMGEVTICENLGLPVVEEERNGKTRMVPGPEGRAIIDQYHAAMPFVKYTSQQTTSQAERKGEIRTLWNRKCRFVRRDDPTTDRFAYPFKALNRRIQGSAADQTKEAMLLMHEAGIIPLITLHDEIGASVRNPDDARIIARIMEEALPLIVPSKVDIEIGENWGKSMSGKLAA